MLRKTSMGIYMHWRQFIYCMDSWFFNCMLSVTCLMIARFYAQHNPHCRPILELFLVQPHKHKLHPTSPRKSLLIMQIFSATRSKYPTMFVRSLRACSSVFFNFGADEWIWGTKQQLWQFLWDSCAGSGPKLLRPYEWCFLRSPILPLLLSDLLKFN